MKPYGPSVVLLLIAAVVAGYPCVTHRIETRDLQRRMAVQRSGIASLEGTVRELRYEVSGRSIEFQLSDRLQRAEQELTETARRLRVVEHHVAETEFRARYFEVPFTRRTVSCAENAKEQRVVIRGGSGLDLDVSCDVLEPAGSLVLNGRVSGITGTLSPFDLAVFCEQCTKLLVAHLPFGNGRFSEELPYVEAKDAFNARLVFICPGGAGTSCDVSFDVEARP